MRPLPLRRQAAKPLGLLLTVLVAIGLLAQAAGSTIRPTPDRGSELRLAGDRLARAIAPNRRHLRSGRFSVLPPGGNPAAVSDERLAGFPVAGRTFAILSNGDARFADDSNKEPDKGKAVNGPLIRGARDVTAPGTSRAGRSA